MIWTKCLKERKKEDLEFALIDRRPRSCAGAPVKMKAPSTKHQFTTNVSQVKKMELWKKVQASKKASYDCTVRKVMFICCNIFLLMWAKLYCRFFVIRDYFFFLVKGKWEQLSWSYFLWHDKMLQQQQSTWLRSSWRARIDRDKSFWWGKKKKK